jgi:hypothetical protein
VRNRDTGLLVGSAPNMDERPYDRGVHDRGAGEHGADQHGGDEHGADRRGGDEHGADRRGGVEGANTVWSIISLLVAGPATWAAIGWLIDEAAGTSVGVPIGVVLGFVGSLYLVYVKYGRT